MKYIIFLLMTIQIFLIIISVILIIKEENTWISYFNIAFNTYFFLINVDTLSKLT